MSESVDPPAPGSAPAPGTPAPGTVIAVVGPTGVGKTAVAEEMALRLGGELVSADSMQIYRGMDIGTAKVPPAERRVPHHCVDTVDPGTAYSAALYQRDAREAIDGILARGNVPIVVGGTGLYVRAALDDWAFPPGSTDTPARERLERLAEEIGPLALHARLVEVDPAASALVHPNNVRRTIRALEMAGEGISYAEQRAGFLERRAVYPVIFVGLTMDRAKLYERINRRVVDMIASGLLDEVRGLLSTGHRDALTSAAAIGYKELVPVLESDAGDAAVDALVDAGASAALDAAVADIQRATRRYAKRQLTWFFADPRVSWVEVTDLDTAAAAERAWEVVTGASEH